VGDLGFDSLTTLEFMAELEKRLPGLPPPPRTLFTPELTVAQLVATLADFPAVSAKAERAPAVTVGWPEVRATGGAQGGARGSGPGSRCRIFRSPRRCAPGRPRASAGRDFINFSSYNYLDLAGDPAVNRRGGRRRCNATAPRPRRAGWPRASGRCTKSWSARSPDFLGCERRADAGERTRDQCHGDRPPVRARGPGDPRQPGPRLHRERARGCRGRAAWCFRTTTSRRSARLLERRATEGAAGADRGRRGLQHGRRPRATRRGDRGAEAAETRGDRCWWTRRTRSACSGRRAAGPGEHFGVPRGGGGPVDGHAL
jgi:hypothetical protein